LLDDFNAQRNNAPITTMYRKMSKKVIARGRGRPKTNPTSIHLTLLPDQLARLDAFLAKQEEELSRAEGVRRVLDRALPEPDTAKPRRAKLKAD
jgi:hypothetical protein